jgi:hypothetical protein
MTDRCWRLCTINNCYLFIAYAFLAPFLVQNALRKAWVFAVAPAPVRFLSTLHALLAYKQL